jgi:hypothetical protein
MVGGQKNLSGPENGQNGVRKVVNGGRKERKSGKIRFPVGELAVGKDGIRLTPD